MQRHLDPFFFLPSKVYCCQQLSYYLLQKKQVIFHLVEEKQLEKEVKEAILQLRKRGERITVGAQISHMVALQRYGWETEECV